MTRRESVLAALRRQEPDSVPFEIGGFNREGYRRFRLVAGGADPDEYFGVETLTGSVFGRDTRFDIGERFLPHHELDPELYRPSLPEDPEEGLFTLNEWGTAFVVGSDSAYDLFVAPGTLLKATTVEEMRQFPRPDFGEEYRYAGIDREVAEMKARDLVVLASVTCTLFERTWQLRGFEELLTDFALHPELAHFLLEQEMETALVRAVRLAEAGVDVLYLGDDVGMQDRLILSPSVWREFLGGRMKTIIEAARQVRSDLLVMYHSDGDVSPLVPDLIDIGVDILNPVQPECMDPAQIKREYGQDLAFWGTFGIQHTLPFGTPAEVDAEVRERIRTVGKGGGLFLAPTHSIAPEVPHENIFAFVKAAKEYGGHEQAA